MYIFGGPVVIEDAVEDQLSELNYTTVRLWGETRIGTSTEVAKYFWTEGADFVVLVADNLELPEDGRFTDVAEAAAFAAAHKVPVIISLTDTLPQDVEETLGVLNAETVRLVGQFEDAVRTALEALGLEVRPISREEIQEEIAERSDKSMIVLVAASAKNFTNVLYSAAGEPGRASYIVSSEDEISDAVAYVKDNGPFDRIKVVGQPELRAKIAAALDAEGIEYDASGNSLAAHAKQLANQQREKFARRIREFKANQERLKEKIQAGADRLIESATASIERANDALARAKELTESLNETYDFSAQDAAMSSAETLLAEAEVDHEAGRYIMASRNAALAKNKAHWVIYSLRPVLGSEFDAFVAEETQNMNQLRARAEQLLQRANQFKAQNPRVNAFVETTKTKIRQALADKEYGKALGIAKQAEEIARKEIAKRRGERVFEQPEGFRVRATAITIARERLLQQERLGVNATLPIDRVLDRIRNR